MLALASVVMLGCACDRGGGSAHPATATAVSEPGTSRGLASAPEGAAAQPGGPAPSGSASSTAAADAGVPTGSASAMSSASAPGSAAVTGPPPAGGCGPPVKQALDVVARCFRKAVTSLQREPKKQEALGSFMSSAKLAGECKGFVYKPDGTLLVAGQPVQHKKGPGNWSHYDDGQAEVRFRYWFNIPGCATWSSAPIEHVMGGH